MTGRTVLCYLIDCYEHIDRFKPFRDPSVNHLCRELFIYTLFCGKIIIYIFFPRPESFSAKSLLSGKFTEFPSLPSHSQQLK